MNNRTLSVFLTISLLLFAAVSVQAEAKYAGSFQAIPSTIVIQMKKYSWRQGCPLPLHKLAYLRLNYWGYDGKVHRGELIVAKDIAPEVLSIFEELYQKRFPIKRMKLIEHYRGNDDHSMADNNTSAFNCRAVTGRRNVFSNHSYGVAIDINPLVNPYIAGRIVAPKNGRKYADRKRKIKGMIVKGDACYTAFKRRGWIWGGSWISVQDYQHFEKKPV
ncbi:MAG: M15 family metallopeptidase, partial [Proteobacteria bacterium]|nr:M15 family metallopeptidase [Pseudomonadota bacterium]